MAQKVFVAKISDPREYAPSEDEIEQQLPEVTLVLDCSGSMNRDLDDVREAVYRLSKTHKKINLILYGDTVKEYTCTASKHADFRQYLNKIIRTMGRTNTAAAIKALQKRIKYDLSDATKRAAVLWLSDGPPDECFRKDTAEAIKALSDSLTPDEKERLSVAAIHYGEKNAEASTTQQIADMAHGDLIRLKTYTEAERQFSLAGHETIKWINTIFGATLQSQVSISAVCTDDGIVCMPTHQVTDQALLQEPNAGFLHDQNDQDLRLFHESTSIVKGHIVFVGETPPTLEQAEWRVINDGDSELLQAIIDQIKTILAGLRSHDEVSSQVMQSIKAQVCSITTALQNSLFPEEQKYSELQIEVVDVGTAADQYKAAQAAAKEKLLKVIATRASKQRSTLIAIMSQLDKLIEKISNHNTSRSSRFAKDKSFAAPEKSVMARTEKLKTDPLENFLSNFDDNGNKGKLLEWLKALSILSETEDLEPHQQSLLSRANANDAVKELLELIGNLNEITPEDISNLFCGCLHICGLPLHITRKNPSAWGCKTEFQQLVGPHGVITISDALMTKKPIPMQDGFCRVNGVMILPPMLVYALLMEFDFDTIAAAMQLRGNPKALPKDAGAFNAKSLHDLIRQVRNRFDFKNVTYFSAIVHANCLLFHRMPKTAREFSELKTLDYEHRNGIADVLSRKYESTEIVAYLGLAPSFNSSDTDFKNLAHEVMMRVYKDHNEVAVPTHKNDTANAVDVAMRYFIAKHLQSCRAKTFKLLYEDEQEAKVTDVITQAHITQIKVVTSDGRDLSYLVPYGAMARVKKGDTLANGQNLITWSHHKEDPHYGENLIRLAWIDAHNADKTIAQHFRDHYQLESLEKLFKLPKQELLNQFAIEMAGNDISPKEYYEFAEAQKNQRKRETLPCRHQLAKYLELKKQLDTEQNQCQKLIELERDTKTLSEDIIKLSSNDPFKIHTLEDALSKYPLIFESYNINVTFPDSVEHPCWRDINKTRRVIHIDTDLFFKAYRPIILAHFMNSTKGAGNKTALYVDLLKRLFFKDTADNKMQLRQFRQFLTDLVSRVIVEETAAEAQGILTDLSRYMLEHHKEDHYALIYLEIIVSIRDKCPVDTLITEYHAQGVQLKVDWLDIKKALETTMASFKSVDGRFLQNLTDLVTQFNQLEHRSHKQLSQFWRIINLGLLPENSSETNKITTAHELHTIITTLHKAGLKEPRQSHKDHVNPLKNAATSGMTWYEAFSTGFGFFASVPEKKPAPYTQIAYSQIPYLMRAYLRAGGPKLADHDEYMESAAYLELCQADGNGVVVAAEASKASAAPQSK
ncbi:MAG: VWA domain-containing protein [Gammaproteobacteria bacterium]|nr:VWA domain-containing protein [Gammaproteobacteria bacterium]